ncbi:hypothetical protein FJT64_003519 [Amphibalanus amphitrite]|uniref:Uncharacterized protein n=1 Tax=Amphibalanus amphitrite TaxID=1232801 RepID=A0A6A4WBD8_AMPAM|nr:hypothetical protein FJT64_003519 [Amphibalanus amphitrite]
MYLGRSISKTGLEMDWDGSADEYTCSAEQSGAASGTGSVLESKLERMCLEVPADFQVSGRTMIGENSSV